MEVEEINEFEPLRDCWNAILGKSVIEDNIFLTWEWLSTWWKYFGEGRRLLLLTVREKDEILAIAPLMFSQYKLLKFGNIRRIEFIGCPHSDYHNFIMVKKERECLKTLLDYLTKNVEKWNWIELREIEGSTPTVNLLYELSSEISPIFTVSERICNICPYIPLPTSFDILLKKLTKNTRQNINKYLRRINRDYNNVTFKRYDETGFSIKEAMGIFIKLHQKRWNNRGFPGAFADRKFHDFHMEIADLFAERGWLGLYFLMVNDEPISTQYTFEYKLKSYYYLAGFDPDFSDYSVGNLTTMFILKECIRRGFREYDMMRGDELYKMMWTKNCRKNYEVGILRKDLYSRLLNWSTSAKALNKLAEKFGISLKISYTT